MSNFKFRRMGGRKYRKWEEWQVGDSIIGKFVSTYEDSYNNECYEISVIECDFEDEEAAFKEGDLVGMGNGSIRYQMQNAEVGSIVKMEYAGEGVMEKGPMKGRKFHDVTVYIDDSTADAEPEQTQEEDEGDFDL